jgi:hypothetical protein
MADSIPAQATQAKGDSVQQYMDDKRWVEEPELMPWYVKELTDLEPATRKLFETYSNVPSDEVVSHIKKVRDKAFRVVSLPAQRMLKTVVVFCIGQRLTFLSFHTPASDTGGSST